MKLFYRIKRDGAGLFVKMYSDCKSDWYAASCQIQTAKDAPAAFEKFVSEIKKEMK